VSKIAKQNIPFGSALAYTRGQTVEDDAVETNDWQDYVVGRDTKEGRTILAELTGEALDAPAKAPRGPSAPPKPAEDSPATDKNAKE
jgi:hypothetical protein